MVYKKIGGAVLAVLMSVCVQAGAQQTHLLWSDGAPGSEKRHGEAETVQNTYVSNIHDPSLTVVKADARHANGAAVVIAPGGGHRMLVWMNEGMVAAKSLNRAGVTAFVLKYRLARDQGSTYSIENDAAADLRRAVRWVRAHATEFGVDPDRVGVMGFSAGGELVSLVADNPAPAAGAKQDAVDKQSARPDFQVLVYPGPLGVPAKAVANAPPAFIVAGSADKCCGPPAVALYQQLVAAGVSAELHMYADTDHAFNMGQRSERLSDVHWPDRLADWLADGGWLVPHGGRSPQGVPSPAP
ncbi:MAG TPA: alpha/beta hydrolase [Duganella sp.]|uniref:alpha/beta hydrolase n=1 Tax=Duganella sp. TaxID=1904440 RepID=UPI002ED44022